MTRCTAEKCWKCDSTNPLGYGHCIFCGEDYTGPGEITRHLIEDPCHDKYVEYLKTLSKDEAPIEQS